MEKTGKRKKLVNGKNWKKEKAGKWKKLVNKKC